MWTYETPYTLHRSPSIADGIVVAGTHYHQSQGSVLGLDARNGTVIWERTLGDTAVIGTPRIREGMAYVADGQLFTGEGAMRSYDLVSGGLQWSYDGGGWLTDAVLGPAGTIAALAPYPGSIVVLDAWSGDFVRAFPEAGVIGIPSAYGEVLVGMSDAGVFALNLTSGKRIWAMDVPAFDPIPIRDKLVFVPSVHQVLVAHLDTGDTTTILTPGAVVAHLATDGIFAYMAAYVGGPGLEYDASQWYVMAMELETGEEKWRHHLGKRSYAPPIVVDGILYQSYGEWDEGGGVIALDAGYLAANGNQDAQSPTSPPSNPDHRTPPRSADEPPAPTSAPTFLFSLVFAVMAVWLPLRRRRGV